MYLGTAYICWLVLGLLEVCGPPADNPSAQCHTSSRWVLGATPSTRHWLAHRMPLVSNLLDVMLFFLVCHQILLLTVACCRHTFSRY